MFARLERGEGLQGDLSLAVCLNHGREGQEVDEEVLEVEFDGVFLCVEDRREVLGLHAGDIVLRATSVFEERLGVRGSRGTSA